MVWHGEGWAPLCEIAQDTAHENGSYESAKF